MVKTQQRTIRRQQSVMLPAQKKGSPEQLIYGILFVIIFGAFSYVIIKQPQPTPAAENYSNFGSVGHDLVKTGAPQEFQLAEADNIKKSASSGISASSAVVLADMSLSQADIKTAPLKDTDAKKGNIMEDIKFATKGDGQIRPVDVNRTRVDNEFVKLAMFENQDFMYRLQATGEETPHLQDPSLGMQKSMFRKMTYPLVTSRGTLGMDVVGDATDNRVTISFSGGRAPNT